MLDHHLCHMFLTISNNSIIDLYRLPLIAYIFFLCLLLLFVALHCSSNHASGQTYQASTSPPLSCSSTKTTIRTSLSLLKSFVTFFLASSPVYFQCDPLFGCSHGTHPSTKPCSRPVLLSLFRCISSCLSILICTVPVCFSANVHTFLSLPSIDAWTRRFFKMVFLCFQR